MQQRLDGSEISPDFYNRYLAFSMAMAGSAIERKIRDLVNIRASQLNGCAFCVDMHVKEARMLGESELRLHHLAVWRDSPLFSARERACLAWTEALTKIADHGVPDELYQEVRAALSEKEISDLTYSVIAINGWNRASIAFRTVPGSLDKKYGLDRAGLA